MARVGYALGVLAVTVIVLAGCGGGDATSSAEPAGESTAAGAPATDKQPAKPKKGAWGVVFGAEANRSA